jgi:hypothetical protein
VSSTRACELLIVSPSIRAQLPDPTQEPASARRPMFSETFEPEASVRRIPLGTHRRGGSDAHSLVVRTDRPRQ